MLAHNADSEATHRALLLPQRSSSAESNNGGEVEGVNQEANIYVARRVFKHDVLWILPSDCDKNPEQTSLGIKD